VPARRVNPTDREAAIVSIVEMASQSDALRSHVHEIVTSAAFSGSRRSSEFLQYLIEKALLSQFDELKERTIGVQLFGRDPSYDTGSDAIVRVTATDVRKRLHRFYAAQKLQSAVRVELSPGSYIVEFRQVAIAEAKPQLLPEIVVNEPLITAPVSPARKYFRRTLAIGLLVAISLITGIVLAAYHWQAPKDAVRRLPWSAMLQGNHQLRIVFSDPDIVALQGVFHSQISLADYADHRYVPDAHSPARIERLFRGNNVPAVDADFASRITTFLSPAPVRNYRARQLESGDFRTDDNFLLLGSPLSDPWVHLFQDQLDFEFRYEAALNEEIIYNKRPASGENTIYAPTVPGWGTGQAFAIVALLVNPNQASHIMILAGSNAAATEAAGKFVTDTEMVSRTLKTHNLNPYDPHVQFEMLLRVTTVASSLNTFDVIACHRLSSLPRQGN
jgi:hypothetical protein